MEGSHPDATISARPFGVVYANVALFSFINVHAKNALPEIPVSTGITKSEVARNAKLLRWDPSLSTHENAIFLFVGSSKSLTIAFANQSTLCFFVALTGRRP